MKNPSQQSATDSAFQPVAARSVVERPKPSTSRRSASGSWSPYNPGLYQLVQGKQAWAEPLEEQAKVRGFLGWHQRGYLPHRDTPGLTQLITFRLHDSFPSTRRAEWQALLQIEDNRQRRTRLEDYRDKGHGACWLRQPRITELAEGALRHFDGERYNYWRGSFMPNHVHVLVRVGQWPLAEILQSWKRFIARESNKILKREGSFWEREYWDTYMRNTDQLICARRYNRAESCESAFGEGCERLVVEQRTFSRPIRAVGERINGASGYSCFVSRLQVGAPAAGSSQIPAFLCRGAATLQP